MFIGEVVGQPLLLGRARASLVSPAASLMALAHALQRAAITLRADRARAAP